MSTPTISNPASFRAEARWQRVCALCGNGGAWHSHHGVFKKLLKQRGLPLYDTRNAIRLCPNCNLGLENRSVRFPLAKLTDQCIEYAFEVLGAYAYDWLKRTYDGDDDRVEIRLAFVSG